MLNERPEEPQKLRGSQRDKSQARPVLLYAKQGAAAATWSVWRSAKGFMVGDQTLMAFIQLYHCVNPNYRPFFIL